MKKLLYITTLCICSFFVASTTDAAAIKLTKHVTDNANVIPDDVEAALEAKLTDFETKTSNQFMVVTLPNLPEGETLESAAYNIFNENELGQKDKNNGLLFLLSTGERKTRFEVGYGLEPILPDILAGRILRDDIAPLFKAGDFGGGFTVAVDKAIEVISKGEVYQESITPTSPPIDPNGAEGLFFVFFLILGFGRVLLSYMAKSKSILAGGVIGLVLSIIGFVLTGIALMFGFIILGLLFDWFISGNNKMGQVLRSLKPSNRSGGFWTGGGGFGGSSGGGGFSGGGGSSGGGGASGGY